MKISVIFFHISCHQLSTALKSWWRLIKVDENQNQPRELKFGISIHFSVYIKIPVDFFSYQLSLAVNSWWQLITVDENENQPKEQKSGKHITLEVKMNINFFNKWIEFSNYLAKLVMAELGKFHTYLIWGKNIDFNFFHPMRWSIHLLR